MTESSLSEKQKETLAYKKHLTETAGEILLLMSKADPKKRPYELPVEIKQKILHIYNDLSSIASLAGGNNTTRIYKAINMLRQDLWNLQQFAGGDLKSQKFIMENWLQIVVGITVRFDQEGRPVDLGFEFDPASLKSKFNLSLGKR